jgi:preprotein translocase subunit YajC
MTIPTLFQAILAQAAPVQGAPAPAEGPPGWYFPVMMGSVFVIFYFLMIRPTQKQEKERRALLESLKKKDRVFTSGGILGTVADLRDDEITLRVCENPDVKIRVRRSAVVEIIREGAAGESEAK